MKRLAVFLFACSPKPEPATVSVAATATATASAPATATAAATASAPAFDLSTCGTTPGCMWSAGWQSACSGAAVRPGTEMRAAQVCVCNGCLADSDCKTKPGGTCGTFPRMCFPEAKACTYPGDLCAKGGEACEKIMSTQSGPAMHEACYHDGSGHVACGPFQWPPP